MSAQPCGCNPEAAWMCKQHLEAALSLLDKADKVFAERAGVTYGEPPPDTLKRFRDRLADEDTMRDTLPIDTPAVRIVAAAVDLLAERQRIAKVLAAFYRAELSMSSVQPILALALELNPDLVERVR